MDEKNLDKYLTGGKTYEIDILEVFIVFNST